MNLTQILGNAFRAKSNSASFAWVAAILLPASVLGQAAVQAPPELTPPPGNKLLLTAHATGTQNYICLPAASGSPTATAWVFVSPQATLFLQSDRFRKQVITHFLSPVPASEPVTPLSGCTVSGDGKALYCPTWQSSFDSSAVWGSKTGSIAAGTDPSCPNSGAVACLLLKAVANRKGTFGDGLLSHVTYVQRLNTDGGSAPAGSCTVGALLLVPYSADYSYYVSDDARNTLGNGTSSRSDGDSDHP